MKVIYPLLRDGLWLTARWFVPTKSYGFEQLADDYVKVWINGLLVDDKTSLWTTIDREGEPFRVYLFNDRAGMSLRHAFIVDKEGIVRLVQRNETREARDQDLWRAKLSELA